MPFYMVIERFKAGNSAAVYERLADTGRALPDGLKFIDSWLSKQDDTCFQLMQADALQSFDKWIAHWNDLVDFDVIELKEKPIGSEIR